MLETGSCVMYTNYLAYLCPICGAHNMCSDILHECSGCSTEQPRCETLQRMVVRRVNYYNKGDTNGRGRVAKSA